MSTEYNPITGDDLRKTIVWICEQMDPTSGFPLCADCGHGFQHHLNDQVLRSCTYPTLLGAPKRLCPCLDYRPDDDDEV